MTTAEIASLLSVFAQAADHHDAAKPQVEHNLDTLAQNAAGIAPSGGFSSVFKALLENPVVVTAIVGLLADLLQRRSAPPAPAPVEPAAPAPAVNTPAFKEPEPPAAPNDFKLEVQIEEGWHDWKKGEGNEDGHFDPQAEIAAGMALPPGPVVRFISGDGSHYERGQKRGYPQTWHFSYDNGESYSFSSDSDGSTQPVHGLGHVQFGPHWDESDGRDVIIRFAVFGGSNPRALTVWVEAKGAKSNVLTFGIAHGKVS